MLSILSYKSTGGNPTYKESDYTLMYTVSDGDTITFEINVTDISNYIWEVNKINKNNNSNIFTYTFTSKDIYEINGIAYISNEKVNVKWILTNIQNQDAPDTFDYFADKKYMSRIDHDPWGRTLPTWTVEQGTIDVSSGSVMAKTLTTGYATISTTTNIVKGTWIFKYKYLIGTPTSYNYLLGIKSKYLNSVNGNFFQLNNPMDGHWWLDLTYNGQRAPQGGYIVNMAGSQIDPTLVGGSIWHEVVFIKDENNTIYSYLDKKLVRWSTNVLKDIIDSNKFTMYLLDITSTPLQYPIIFDSIQIYKDKYIHPQKSIYYDSLNENIVITGGSITLKDISDSINNSTIFSYDNVNKKAILYKNILITRGSELLIENHELTIHTELNTVTKGRIKYNTDSAITIINSDVKTDSIYVFLFSRISEGSDSCLKNRFTVINSSVSNFDGLFLERPIRLIIENSMLNVNGVVPINVYFRFPIQDISIKNSTFVGNTGNEIIRFNGGDQFSYLIPYPVGMDITNCDFSGLFLELLNDSTYYLSPSYPGSSTNLINCIVPKLNITNCIVRHKYYLDVLIIDSNNNPISNCEINILNEQSDINVYSENLLNTYRYYTLSDQLTPTGQPYFSGQTGNIERGTNKKTINSKVYTNSIGHTELPITLQNTIIVTASIKGNLYGQTYTENNYTYKISANKGLVSKEVYNITPDNTFYRIIPNTYQNSIIIKLDICPTPICNINLTQI